MTEKWEENLELANLVYGVEQFFATMTDDWDRPDNPRLAKMQNALQEARVKLEWPSYVEPTTGGHDEHGRHDDGHRCGVNQAAGALAAWLSDMDHEPEAWERLTEIFGPVLDDANAISDGDYEFLHQRLFGGVK